MIFEVCAWESIERLTREGKQVSGSLLPLHEMRWMNLQHSADIYWLLRLQQAAAVSLLFKKWLQKNIDTHTNTRRPGSKTFIMDTGV